jgi:hypothetical protein
LTHGGRIRRGGDRGAGVPNTEWGVGEPFEKPSGPRQVFTCNIAGRVEVQERIFEAND